MIPSFILKNLKSVIVYVVVALLIGGYFFWSQKKISNQADTISKYETAIDLQNKTINNLHADIEQIKKINNDLIKIERESAANASELSDKLRKLESVAKTNPSVVEKIINDAAKDRNRCFEIATGSPLKENEENAVCPHFVH